MFCSLGKRKGELDAQKKAAEKEKNREKVPKGMVLVSEDARRETLTNLQSNYNVILSDLQASIHGVYDVNDVCVR